MKRFKNASSGTLYGMTWMISEDTRNERNTVETIIILLSALAVFDIASLLWGVNSTDDVDSPEWERRRNWLAFH
jgi:hypothetical protein